MGKVKKPNRIRSCAECIHEFACQAWNIGHIHDMDATRCSNYETVKDSPAYIIGLMDGRAEKKTNADRIRSMSDEELAKFFCPETPGPSPWCEPIGRVRCGKAPCWKCMLKWLRQPAKEG